MNLWVKRTGQFLIAALFLMSCEDDSFLLGFQKNKRFNVGYREFNVGEGTVVSVDSILTDNFSGTQRLLIGQYNDPVLGTVRTESFAEFLPISTLKLAIDENLGYEYDSLVMQLRLDFYSYGLVGSGEEFTVHRITEDTLTYRKDVVLKIKNSSGQLVDSTVSSYGSNRYFTNSTIGYDFDPLQQNEVSYAQLSIRGGKENILPTNLTLDNLSDARDENDTLLARVRLSDSFGQELFNVALNNTNSEFSDNKKFRSRFKGLAFIPSESYSVIGFTPTTTISRVRLYYHSTDNGLVKDTLYRDFVFGGVSFHSIEANRTAEFPNPEPPYIGTMPGSGTRVVQSGNPLVTKIDLEKFYTTFADTINNEIVINSAELIVESVSSQEGYNQIPFLELRIMKENDRYVDYRILEDSALVQGYSVITDTRHYYVSSDVVTSSTPIATSLNFNSNSGSYSGYLTLFVQSLFNNKNNPTESRLRYLGLYPATTITGQNVSSVGKSINRSIFSKNNIKLKVYYTSPTISNQ